ncbi:MAG: SUMF1/EgtB/PvdO family nonheme iron enzyme [Pontiellaceae bacterium]|nr:SUMF1/EgtB/PvdO family nonheme iron enzyme [Pontiellaceae bacterium]MBN2784088.1 SUMF1/EgtB/PvdO family nonheme iron enzyme [Pontiellaceae bacterium]
MNYLYEIGTLHTNGSFAVTDQWNEFRTYDGAMRYQGDDMDGEQTRFDGGLNMGGTFAVGQTVTNSASLYLDGIYRKDVSINVQLLGIETVTLLAGTFEDCLHLRFSPDNGNPDDQVWDEWRSITLGIVKMKGISGRGSDRLRELEWYHAPVTGIFAATAYGHFNIRDGVDGFNEPDSLTLSVSTVGGSNHTIRVTGDGGEFTAPVVQTGEQEGAVLRNLSPLDFDGWNIPEIYYLADGGNRVFAFRGQEDADLYDLSIMGSALSDAASVTVDDFVGTWAMKGFSNDNLKNPAEVFSPMAFNLTVSKVDATHLTASIEGMDIPLVISGQTAMLQSGPVSLLGSRVVHFQMSTDGAGVSLFMGTTERADNTDASAFIGLGSVVSLPVIRAALFPTAGGLVVSWNAVDGYACDVFWTSNLTNTFQSIAAGLFYPQDSYTDTVHSATSVGYYRVSAAKGSSAPAGMVLIPAGTNSGTVPESGAYSLTVTNSFYMDATEVTKAQWDSVYSWAITNGYSFRNSGLGKGTDHPVHTVNWYDCVKWCNARSEKDGKTPCYTVSGSSYKTGESAPDCNFDANGYRLPTNDEWEYAARGGQFGNRFPWGDTITHSEANYWSYWSDGEPYYFYDENSASGYHPDYYDFFEGGPPYTSPAASFASNGYGLYDMSGNVCEWCWDAIYSSHRYFRGGSWFHHAYYARCDFAYWNYPYSAYDYYGFRAVCR